jgi:hypothetical protein
LPFLPNLVPSGAAKFKPCTGNGLRSIFGFLSFCRRLNDMVFLSSSPVGRRWTAGKGPVRPRTIGRDSIDQGISQPVRRGNGRQKDPPVRRRAREGRLDRAAVFAAEAVGLLDRKGPADRLTRAPFTTLFFVAGRRLLARTSAAKDPSAGPVGRPYPTLAKPAGSHAGRAWGFRGIGGFSADPTPPDRSCSFWKSDRKSAYSGHGVKGLVTVFRTTPPRSCTGFPISAMRPQGRRSRFAGDVPLMVPTTLPPMRNLRRCTSIRTPWFVAVKTGMIRLPYPRLEVLEVRFWAELPTGEIGRSIAPA